jgi:hypothetical protein
MPKQYDPPLVYRSLSEWVELMKTENFVQVGYSDAEWFCMTKIKADGAETGLGQKMLHSQGNLLLNILLRRWDNNDWHFAMPDALWNGEIGRFEGDKVGLFLRALGIKGMPIYERDIFTDYAARDAKLFPLIDFLRENASSVVIVGPEELSSFVEYVGPFFHVPIPSPNFHTEPKRVERTANSLATVLKVSGRRICLVSAGVSSPVLIDRTYTRNPDAVYFDCGSIWDAFVGIGGQRQWRADLYANPVTHNVWKKENCNG